MSDEQPIDILWSNILSSATQPTVDVTASKKTTRKHDRARIAASPNTEQDPWTCHVGGEDGALTSHKRSRSIYSRDNKVAEYWFPEPWKPCERRNPFFRKRVTFSDNVNVIEFTV